MNEHIMDEILKKSILLNLDLEEEAEEEQKEEDSKDIELTQLVTGIDLFFDMSMPIEKTETETEIMKVKKELNTYMAREKRKLPKETKPDDQSIEMDVTTKDISVHPIETVNSKSYSRVDISTRRKGRKEKVIRNKKEMEKFPSLFKNKEADRFSVDYFYEMRERARQKSRNVNTVKQADEINNFDVGLTDNQKKKTQKWTFDLL